MKRYKDISYKLARISPLREGKEGEWLKHEDVKKFVRKLLYAVIPSKSYTDEQIEMYIDMF